MAITLRRPGIPHRIVSQYRKDYAVPKDSVLYEAWTELGEHVALFASQDGSGLALISKEPAAYIEGSRKQDFALMARGSPNEFEFEPGTFDLNDSDSGITLDTKISLF